MGVKSDAFTCQPNIMKIVHNWLDIIQNKLFPPTCILCGNAGMGSQDLCSSCYQRMPRNNLCCYRCAEIFEVSIVVPALCGRCLSETPAFDET
jgi:predicted amidophosphoribosyltransferase